MSETCKEPLRRFDLPAFIAKNLPLAPLASIPEIRLHRAGAGSGLWRLAERDEGFGSPYWAYPWAGGLALARYVLDHPHHVRGQRVLDLGAGSGLVGIAAAKAGACSVLAADIDRYAAAALGLNAAANDVTIASVGTDMTLGAPPEADIVLVGDLFYDRDLALRVTNFLDRCLAAGLAVLIGDPWRAFLPRSRLRLLADYAVADVGGREDASGTPSAVFAFEPDETEGRRRDASLPKPESLA